jgi:hypothetical protein
LAKTKERTFGPGYAAAARLEANELVNQRNALKEVIQAQELKNKNDLKEL